MKTLLAYYSFSGKTKALCEQLRRDGVELCEIRELSKPSKLGAYTKGCFRAIKGRSCAIASIDADFGQYGKIFLACPVWAGNLAPAGVAFLEKLSAAGRGVTVLALSASGSDPSQNIRRVASGLRISLDGVISLKAGQPAPENLLA